MVDHRGIKRLRPGHHYIDEPTLLFIHPNDIISWKNLSEEAGGYYVLFKKDFVNQHPQLKAVIDKFGLFTQKEKVSSVLRFFELLEKATASINYTTPIRIKTAREFAGELNIHPNYLNGLLKKHTGQTPARIFRKSTGFTPASFRKKS